MEAWYGVHSQKEATCIRKQYTKPQSFCRGSGSINPVPNETCKGAYKNRMLMTVSAHYYMS